VFRYELKLDSAILAEEKHLSLYKELVDKFQVRRESMSYNETYYQTHLLLLDPRLTVHGLFCYSTGAIHCRWCNAECYPCGTVDDWISR